MTSHPWKVRSFSHLISKKPVDIASIVDANGKTVAQLMSRDTARLIVHRVNVFDELLDACQRGLAGLEGDNAGSTTDTIRSIREVLSRAATEVRS